jgi:hypothetical protein
VPWPQPVPVDGDRFDVGHRIDQALVAQVAEHQQLGRRAEGHEGDQLALVDEDGERPFGGNGDLPLGAELVAHGDGLRQRRAGGGQAERRAHAARIRSGGATGAGRR